MTLFGVDYSHYDAPVTHGAVAEGFTFFTHKAGGDANDGELAAWWNDMKGYRDRVLLGAYWVLYPGTPSARADAFISRLDSQCPGWRDAPFILQVDCEKWNGDASTVPSKNDIQAFCDRLTVRMPKLKPIVYAPYWVYGNTLSGLPYPIWASSYVNGAGAASALYPGDTSSKWGNYGGQTPAILQFTSSATIAGQTTCDANAFRGTLDELTALIAPGWEVDVALTDAEISAIATAVWKQDGIIAAPAGSKNSDGSDNLYWAAGTYLTNVYNKGVAIRNQEDVLLNAVQAPVLIDVPALAAAIVAALPAQPGAPLTGADVETAVRNVLHNA
jgi:hypothetical protein